MTTKQLLMPICLSALVYLSGCTGIQVAGDVQSGRNALHTGRPNDAVTHFRRAADIDPAYKIPYRVPVGVLTYLGRAYYETGKHEEVRKSLEQALRLNKDDSLAHLYLGLTLLRTGGRDRGRKEIEGGLKGIHETLEYIASDNIYGIFWDPARMIRSDIEKTLAGKLDDASLTVAALRIGREFEEEIDQARRDEARRRGGRDGGGGD
jgi:tetratricopeptide (TPR) repeat protein